MEKFDEIIKIADELFENKNVIWSFLTVSAW
jgi:hypothetical protein